MNRLDWSPRSKILVGIYDTAYGGPDRGSFIMSGQAAIERASKQAQERGGRRWWEFHSNLDD
jgi:hypothetical protein